MTFFGTGIAEKSDGAEAGETATRKALNKMDVEEADFALVLSSPEYDYKPVLEAVKDVSNADKVIGCSTAGEFTEKEVGKGSISVALVKSDEMKFFTGIGHKVSKDVINAVQEAAEDLPREVEGYPYMAGINLHDGLAGKGESITLAAYQMLDIPFSGGSAGDDMRLEETHVFTEDEIVTDGVALAVIASKKPFAFSVNHGHKPISPSMEITEADGSTVHSIDGKTAIEVWKDQIREEIKEQYEIDVDNLDEDSQEFKKLLGQFEIGLETEGGNYKVRAPVLTQMVHGLSGPMEFTVEIPEGARIRIMDTTKESQIESNRDAAIDAVNNMKEDYSGAMVFECKCREMILREDFDNSVEVISEELDAPLVGCEVYGEVNIDEGKLSGYHNTTTSILLFPK